MLTEQKTSTAYLSVYTDSAGQRAWTAFVRNTPICAAMPEEGRATRALRKFIGESEVWVWDGDVGEFTHKIVLR